jgi:catechol 2,3-dioxygenase-like lactoylglutathione lyase family enzyme
LKLGHIEIFTPNLSRAQEFYQVALGAELVADQGDFIWVKLGEVEVLLRKGDPPKPADDYRAANIALVLYSQDVAISVSRLNAAGVAVLPIEGEPGCYTFQDPDGNWLQLVDPRAFQG